MGLNRIQDHAFDALILGDLTRKNAYKDAFTGVLEGTIVLQPLAPVQPVVPSMMITESFYHNEGFFEKSVQDPPDVELFPHEKQKKSLLVEGLTFRKAFSRD